MKNFRIFDGITQYLAADACEITGQRISFYASGNLIRTYELSQVRMVEELDDGFRPRKIIYKREEGSSA
jgi:hypothetical protein